MHRELSRDGRHFFSVGAIGAAEHAAKHLVDHTERPVRENRFHLAGEHDQSRQSARRIETREMLSAEYGRFPSNRSSVRDESVAHDLARLPVVEQIASARQAQPSSFGSPLLANHATRQVACDLCRL